MSQPISYDQIMAQNAKAPEQPLSVEGCWAKSVLDVIENAEKIYPAGTYEHGQALGAALASQWPKMKHLLTRMVR